MISFVRNNSIYLAAAHRPFNHNPTLRLLPLLLALFFPSLVAPSHAEISGNGVPPPGAVPAEIHVARGGSAVIKLRTYGPTVSVKYIIRAKPKYGRLAEVTVFRNGEGTVLYQHSGDSDSSADQFTYAAQTWRGTSAAATVNVIIDDQPAKVNVPDAFDFGNVPLGETKTLSLKASNSGSGAAAGILSTNNPWQLASKSVYRIAGGGELEVSVTFAPTYLGPVEGALNFSSGGGLVTTLKGRGVEPFSIEPASVTVPAKPPRVAGVNVHNLLQQPLTLQVKAPAPFIAPATLQIAPGATMPLPISVAADQLDPVDGVVEFASDAFTARVKVSADPVLSKLEVASSKLSFPATKIGEAATATLSVKNTGGRRAEVSAAIDAPFSLAVANRTFAIEPGTERTVSVHFTPTTLGSPQATLTLQTSGQRLVIVCDGEAILASVATPRPHLQNALPTEESPPETAADQAPEPEKLSSIPAIKSVEALKINRTSVLLTWAAFNDSSLRYEVQCLDLSLDSEKNLRIQWIPIPKVETKVKDGVATAWVTGMKGGRNLICRVITRDAQGLPSAPSPELRAQTPNTRWLSFKGVLFTILAILVALIARSKWQARHERPAGF